MSSTGSLTGTISYQHMPKTRMLHFAGLFDCRYLWGHDVLSQPGLKVEETSMGQWDFREGG